MPAGKALIGLALIALSGPFSQLSATANPDTPLGERLLDAIPLLSGEPPPAPQAVQQAEPDGPAIDPSRLDRPADIERQLREALGDPLTDTRLTITNGIARLGNYNLGSSESVRGHVVVLKGDAEIHGRLEGNIVTLDGDIVIHPGAAVVGDVLAIGGRVRDVEGGITGTIAQHEATPLPEQPFNLLGTLARRSAGMIGVFLTLLTLGFGLVTFGRPNLEIVSDTVTHSFGRAFVVGLLGQILVLPTFGMLMVGLVLTVAGALLLPFAVVVYGLLAIVAVLGGVLAVAHAMGEVITRRRMAAGLAASPNSYRYLTTGLLAIAATWLAWVAFGWVPVAGAIIFTAALLGSWFVATVGFGAALLSRGGIREEFTGRLLPPAMMTDEYLWATPQLGVPAVKRPDRQP